MDASPRAVSVRFGPASRLQAFLLSEPVDPPLAAREDVIVATEHGPESAQVEAVPQAVLDRRPAPQAQPVAIRRARPEDAVERLKHEQRATEARRYAMERIRAQQLPMKLTRVEQAFDGSRLIFYFTADGARRFPRAGARAGRASSGRASRCGRSACATKRRCSAATASCGRPLCCTTFLTSFEPVSIKMAKQQDLSLNPSKLSGLCGRLKCCLRYELPNAQGRRARRLRQRRRLRQPARVRHRRRQRQRLAVAERQLRLRACPSMKPRIAHHRRRSGRASARRSPAKAAADPRVLEVCEPVVYAPPPDLRRSRRACCRAEAGRAAYDAIVRAVGRRQARRASTRSPRRPSTRRRSRSRACRGTGTPICSAHLTGASHVAMMFYSDALRVVLATVHVALREVPRAAHDASCWRRTIALTARELPRFGVAAPRIAVAGLNPHAGEHGLFGREEDDVIAPAVDACRARRHRRRPARFPADTCFVRAHRGEFDVVVACYHDQGLIPVKLLAFGQAVNVTLGLPIIRTSVDHGTAFDIAGRGHGRSGTHDCGSVARRRRLVTARRSPAHRVRPTRDDLTRRDATKAQRIIAENRKALHDYHLLETFEAGVVLLGTEVKSIREGRVNLRDSFARVEDGEVCVYNVHISPYSQSRLRRPRAAAAPQAAAASPRDPQADWQDRRARHDARAASPVLQERPRQGRGQSREGQEGTTSARPSQARGRSRDTRRDEKSAAIEK